MEQEKSFVGELIGKAVWVTTAATAGGTGTRDASAGKYRGTLIDFDGRFLKVEYDVVKFSGGTSVPGKDVILINASYVVTLEEYKESLSA